MSTSKPPRNSGHSNLRTIGLCVVAIGIGMLVVVSTSAGFGTSFNTVSTTSNALLTNVDSGVTTAAGTVDDRSQAVDGAVADTTNVFGTNSVTNMASIPLRSTNSNSAARYETIIHSNSTSLEDSTVDLDMLLRSNTIAPSEAGSDDPTNLPPIRDYSRRSQRIYQRTSRTESNWDPKKVMPTEAVYKHFENTLAIMMISPPRYHIVEEVRKHYAPFFRHMVFCGPKNNSDYGLHIHGYDVVFGNLQYLAVKNILKHYLANETMRRAHEPPKGWEEDESLLKPDHITGMIYIADDLLLQPWSIAAKNYNKHIPWAVQMGIGHIRSWDKVAAVPMMAVESKFRKAGWPYWRRNHGKMNRVLAEGGEHFRKRLAMAAKATHPQVYKWSKYNRMNYSMEDAHEWTIFYTIIDTYYVPRALWQGYIIGAELMAKHWVFGECAIATVLRALHPTYEEMAAQFYWSGGSANDCVRFKWSVHVDSFHRCRHDHVFADLMYSDDETRDTLNVNASYLKQALAMRGLYPVAHKPMQKK